MRFLKKPFGANRLWAKASGLTLFCVVLIFLQVAQRSQVDASPHKTPSKAWTPWADMKQQVKCHGKIVKAFTPKDAGDSPRSNPEPVLLGNRGQFTRYEKALCLEKSGGMPYRKSLEWVQLKNGLSVAIANEGFESYGLGFYWVLPSDKQPFTNKQYWLNRSKSLLSTILPMVRRTDKGMVTEAIQMIQGHIQRKDPLALENTVLDNGQEIATRVFWDKMRSLPGGRKGIQVTVSVGPL